MNPYGNMEIRIQDLYRRLEACVWDGNLAPSQRLVRPNFSR